MYPNNLLLLFALRLTQCDCHVKSEILLYGGEKASKSGFCCIISPDLIPYEIMIPNIEGISAPFPMFLFILQTAEKCLLQPA